MKFVLLHEGKNDEGIRAFLMEVWELYVKVSVLCVSGAALTGADDAEPIPHGAHGDPERGI